MYYSQKDYHKLHLRWAVTLEELGLEAAPAGPFGAPVLKATPEGYECTVELTMPESAPRQWTIRHDALIKETTQS